MSEKTQTSDEILVRRAQDGDRAAVTELCGRHRPPLVSFCTRYLGDPEEAEDAAQDVLARIAVENRWPSGDLRPWLFRAARNDCLNRQKRRRDGRIGVGTFFSSKLPTPRTGPATAANRRERDERLWAALASMPAEQAEVLSMRYFENLRPREMAEVLDVSIAVVRARLKAARHAMERELGGDEP